MSNRSVRTRLAVLVTLVTGVAIFSAVKFGTFAKVDPEPAAVFVTTMSATNNDALFTDVDADGRADPGDTLEYTVVVTNTGAENATSVIFSDTLSADLTLVGGSVNTSAIAVDDNYTATGNVPIAPAASVLANDIDPLTGIAVTGATVTKVNGAGGNVGVATNTTAAGLAGVTGSVTVAANGTFTYEPPPGFVGNDTFTYHVTRGGLESGATTVTIAISNAVWFISNTGGGLNRGTFSNPFTTIASFNTVNTGAAPNAQPGHHVVIRDAGGTYNETDGINLRDNQTLTGPAVAFNTVFTANANSTAAYTTFAASTGAAATINAMAGNGIDLASGNAVRGLDVGNTPGFFKLNGTAVGSLVIGTANLTGTGGAINVSTSGAFASAVNIGTFASSSSPGANVNLVGVTGTLGITSGGTGFTGSPATFNAVNVSGGTVGFTYPANVTKATTGALVSVSGGHATGTITFNTGTLSDTVGTGLQFDNADGTYNFNGTNTLNGGDAGIDILNGSTGTFTFGTGTAITRANSVAGAAFNLTSSNANVTYSGSLTLGTTTGNMVAIDNHDAGTMTFQTGTLSKGSSTTQGITITNSNGGTINFNNPTIAITMTSGKAINLATNTGGTMNFTPAAGGNGIDITSTSANTFDATGGGTVVVTGAGNTIASTTGTALNVDNTNIGLSGLTFISIAANGGANGIILNNTGTTAGTHGGLTVTGSATTDASGGTIQNTTGRGASFITARNISLSNMTFTNAGTTDLDADNSGLSTGDNLDTNAAIHLVTVAGNATLDNVDISGGAEQGINGNTVAAFSLLNSTITNVGNAADEDNIHFYNMSGTSAITSTTLTHTSGGGDDNMNLQTQSGTLNLTISGGSAVGTAGGVNQLGSGYLFGIRGTTNATINFNNSSGAGVSSTNNFSGGLVADVFDTATMALNVSNFTSSGNNDQLSVSAGDNSNVDLNVSNCTLSSVAAGDFVAISLLGSAFDNGFTFDSRIQNNTITVANGLTADGIIAFNAGGGVMNMSMTGNTIDYAGTQRAIIFQAGQDGNGTNNLTITGNTIDVKLDGAGNAVTGILAQTAITGPGNTSSLCADIGGAGALSNTFTHSLGGVMAGGDIRVRQRNDGTIRLPSYVGVATDTTAVATFLNGRNVEVSPSTATADSTGFAGGAACTQPNPIPPPADEEAANMIHGLDNILSFVNAPWNSGEWRVASGEFSAKTDAYLVISPSTESTVTSVENQAALGESQPTLGGSQPTLGESQATLGESQATLGESQATLGESQATLGVSQPTLGQSYAALGANIAAFAGKFAEMISPTVYSAPMSGETVTVNGAGSGFTLPVGKAVTIKFRATIDAPPPFLTQVTNQGSVSGVNFTSPVLTDDPSIGGATDPTLTIVDSTTVAITSSQNPSLTGQSVTFTATLTGAPVHATGDPGGTVEFFEDGNSLGSVAVVPGAVNDNTGTATLNTTAVPTGSNVITATFSGGGTGPGGFNANSSSTTGGTNVTQVVGNTAVWDGSASTDWNTAANWATNLVPTSTHSVSLPSSGVTNQPNLSAQDTTVVDLAVGANRTLTIAGGRTLTVAGVLTMNGLNVDATAGLLEIGGAGSVVRTSGVVLGPMRKVVTSAPIAGESPQFVFVYPLGTSTGFSPATANFTAGSGSLTVAAINGTAPSSIALSDATTLDRYWQMIEVGSLTASMTFQYLQADVDGNEANYRLIRATAGGPAIGFPNGSPCPGAGSPCVNTTADTIFVANVESFANFWTAGELAPPTAANVDVSGRVLTVDGRGVSKARVTMTDGNGSTVYALTNPFGYYRFVGVASGQDYVMIVTSKQYRFASRVVSVSDNIAGLDFVALPPE